MGRRPFKTGEEFLNPNWNPWKKTQLMLFDPVSYCFFWVSSWRHHPWNQNHWLVFISTIPPQLKQLSLEIIAIFFKSHLSSISETNGFWEGLATFTPRSVRTERKKVPEKKAFKGQQIDEKPTTSRHHKHRIYIQALDKDNLLPFLRTQKLCRVLLENVYVRAQSNHSWRFLKPSHAPARSADADWMR